MGYFPPKEAFRPSKGHQITEAAFQTRGPRPWYNITSRFGSEIRNPRPTGSGLDKERVEHSRDRFYKTTPPIKKRLTLAWAAVEITQPSERKKLRQPRDLRAIHVKPGRSQGTQGLRIIHPTHSRYLCSACFRREGSRQHPVGADYIVESTGVFTTSFPTRIPPKNGLYEGAPHGRVELADSERLVLAHGQNFRVDRIFANAREPTRGN